MRVLLPNGISTPITPNLVWTELRHRGVTLQNINDVFNALTAELQEGQELSFEEFAARIGQTLFELPIVPEFFMEPKCGQLTVLLIGNNDYLPQGGGGADLPGVLRDVAAWRSLIPVISEAQTYATLDFQVLQNQTAAQMRAAIATLLDPNLKPHAGDFIPAGGGEVLEGAVRDTRLLIYSGHGGGVRDISGDEVTGIDAGLLGTDARALRRDPNVGVLIDPATAVTDDDISSLAAKVTSLACLYFFYDCCYNGGASRPFLAGNPRLMLRPRSLTGIPNRQNRDIGQDRAAAGRGCWLEASRWDETAKETAFGGGQYTAAVSGALNTNVYATPDDLTKVATAATAYLAKKQPPNPQTPQLEDLNRLGSRPFLEGCKWV
jgi:hypothetical protein